MTSFTLRLSALLLLTMVASLLLAAGVGATITNVSVTAGLDPQEDVPFTLSLSGDSDDPGAITLYLSDAGYDCQAGHGDVAPRGTLFGHFSFVASATVNAPGPYDVCLLDGAEGWTRSVVGHVDVRATRGSVAISAPRIAPAGGGVAVTLSGTSELPEQLYLETSRYGQCDTYNVMTGDDVAGEAVSGPFTRTFRIPTPDDGRLFICAYVQESTNISARPIARAQALVLVSAACGRSAQRVAGLRVAARRAHGSARVRAQRRLAAARRARRRSCGG